MKKKGIKIKRHSKGLAKLGNIVAKTLFSSSNVAKLDNRMFDLRQIHFLVFRKAKFVSRATYLIFRAAKLRNICLRSNVA